MELLLGLQMFLIAFLGWVVFRMKDNTDFMADELWRVNESVLQIKKKLQQSIEAEKNDPANTYAKRQNQRALEVENLLYGAGNKLGGAE